MGVRFLTKTPVGGGGNGGRGRGVYLLVCSMVQMSCISLGGEEIFIAWQPYVGERKKKKKKKGLPGLWCVCPFVGSLVLVYGKKRNRRKDWVVRMEMELTYLACSSRRTSLLTRPLPAQGKKETGDLTLPYVSYPWRTCLPGADLWVVVVV